MGLTIHYGIAAPAGWNIETVKARLEAARQYALALPVVGVSELTEFKGPEAEQNRESGRRKEDEFLWCKIQAQRSLCNPWLPGTSASQSPDRMIVFSVDPADGAEQMNVGACWYPEYIWPPRQQEDSVPAWSLVFRRHCGYPESRKVMRAFLARWGLRKLPASKNDGGRRYRLGGTAREICRVAGGLGQATLQRGRYLSHRRGYAGEFGLVELRDRMVYGLLFRYRGSAEEALRVFASPEFQADLTGMISGRPYVTPAAGGIWSSFCKTQYANDPRHGGWNNFARAHLSVLALLEHLQGLGFRVRIRDEGGFWENRDFAALGKALGEYDVAIAGMIGALKEQARESGMTAQSAMDGRGDFEHLEARAQEGPVGRMVSQLRGI